MAGDGGGIAMLLAPHQIGTVENAGRARSGDARRQLVAAEPCPCREAEILIGRAFRNVAIDIGEMKGRIAFGLQLVVMEPRSVL